MYIKFPLVKNNQKHPKLLEKELMYCMFYVKVINQFHRHI